MLDRQTNFLGQMRYDVPLFRIAESSVAHDFDVLSGETLAGKYSLVVKGFTTITSNAIGSPATNLQVIVANSILQNYNSSESGSLFSVPSTRAIEVLSTTNPRVIGSFTSNAVNYIGVDTRRNPDPTTSDLVQFLDANTNQEVPEIVPLGRTLDYVIVISTQDFSTTPTIAPIAKVLTDVNNNVLTITDARNLTFRLGSGGSVPNAFFSYPWPFGRTEIGDNSDFQVGDKALVSLKDWCNAVMSRIWEIGGGPFWYSPTADRNVFFTRTGATFPNGENFTWDGTNLLWQGLAFYFDNSPGIVNEIANQTSPLPGLTDLTNGQALYVDLDRTQNRTRLGGNALQAVKANLATLGTPTVPGSRQVIAINVNGIIFTKDSSFPVGATFFPATTTSLGIVELSKAPLNPLVPIVLSQTEKGAANGVASLDGSQRVIGTGLTRGTLGPGSLVIGQGTDDTTVDIGGFSTTFINIASENQLTLGGLGNVNITTNNAVVNVTQSLFDVALDTVASAQPEVVHFHNTTNSVTHPNQLIAAFSNDVGNVATIDNLGNATFSAEVNAREVGITNIVTGSGVGGANTAPVTMYGQMVPIAGANCTGTGGGVTVNRQWNITAASRGGTGQYTFTLHNNFSSAFPIIQVSNLGGTILCSPTYDNPSQFTIQVYNLTPSPPVAIDNQSFSFIIWDLV